MNEPWPCGSTQNRPILPLAFLTYLLFTIYDTSDTRHDHLCARDSLCPNEYRAPSALLRPSRHALRSRSAWVGEPFRLSSTLAAYTTPGVHLLATSFQLAGNLLVSSLE
jgi:hypothetical protein